MEFFEAIKIALQSLWANKLRSVLTLIGVVIGVASVIAVITLTNGVNKYVATKVYGYGADVFTLSKQPAVIFSYAEYEKWGSIAHPLRTVGVMALNWAFWYRHTNPSGHSPPFALVINVVPGEVPEAVASAASVSSGDGPQQIVDLAMDTWGRVDGLIHNAAIVLDDHFEDVTDDDLDSILAVNLRGTFRTVRAAYRAMKDTGGGRIVTLSSTTGFAGYDVSHKPSDFSFMKRVTQELYPDGADYDRAEMWAGLRPMTPTNLPFFGRSRMRNLFLNTGHGHIGWTMSHGSARITADLIAGRTPAIPMDGLLVA